MRVGKGSREVKEGEMEARGEVIALSQRPHALSAEQHNDW